MAIPTTMDTPTAMAIDVPSFEPMSKNKTNKHKNIAHANKSN